MREILDWLDRNLGPVEIRHLSHRESASLY
jgi:hypothetical protein